MLSKKAGKSIFRHLSEICEGTVTAESITCLTDEEIKSSGISKSKVKFIRELTRAVSDGSLNFEHISELDDESALKQFMKIYGIGRWSAKMYLIFVLNRPDILPFEDAAFLQVYDWMYKTEDNAPASVIKKFQKWKPYSSIAAICTVPWIWDLPKKFHLYKQEGI